MTLQRSGAILLQGTENVHIVGCHLTRIDGNGIFLSNYNRNTTIASNEMSWIGDGAIAAWGSTGRCLNANCTRKLKYAVGPDARGGNQPRGTHVVGNLVPSPGNVQYRVEKQGLFATSINCMFVQRNAK